MAIEAGSSTRRVAARFEVSPSAVSKISSRYRKSGRLGPLPMGGDRRSHVIETHGARILELLRAHPDLTVPSLRAVLHQEGIEVGNGGFFRFLARHRISFKKKRCTPANRIAPTSPGGVSAGASIKAG